MSAHHYPAVTVVTCDRCGVERKQANGKHLGRLVLNRAALDAAGEPVADASICLDLCDGCVAVMADAITAAFRHG